MTEKKIADSLRGYPKHVLDTITRLEDAKAAADRYITTMFREIAAEKDKVELLTVANGSLTTALKTTSEELVALLHEKRAEGPNLIAMREQILLLETDVENERAASRRLLDALHGLPQMLTSIGTSLSNAGAGLHNMLEAERADLDAIELADAHTSGIPDGCGFCEWFPECFPDGAGTIH